MNLEIIKTEIPGCFLFKKQVFSDNRGDFFKFFENPLFQQFGINFNPAECFFTKSGRNVLRGMHFQTPPDDHMKLFTCLTGKVLDVVVDLRKNSPSFCKSVGFHLEGLSGESILIPRGCAHGFYSFEEDTLVGYLAETPHVLKNDTGILWNSFDFPWPTTSPVISVRDAAFSSIQNFQSPF
jgi:dTDP-4-dehydrorhamnose 3,5-epimerase